MGPAEKQIANIIITICFYCIFRHTWLLNIWHTSRLMQWQLQKYSYKN